MNINDIIDNQWPTFMPTGYFGGKGPEQFQSLNIIAIYFL